MFSQDEVKAILRRYTSKLISLKIPITHVYMYGSYAKGNPRKDSDVDVCVISPSFSDRIDATMTLMKIRDDKELIISPIAFSPETFVDENPLAWEIKQTGISMN